MQSNAADVDTYLAEVPDERRDVLTRLRDLCRAELQAFDEVMAYERCGVAEVAFASQMQCISFYLMRGDAQDAFEERLAGRDMGKGCLRFGKPGSVGFWVLQDLLRAVAAASGPVC